MTALHQTLGQAIESQKDDLAKRIVDEQWARNPPFQVRYGQVGQAKLMARVQPEYWDAL